MKPTAWATLVTLTDWTDALERLLAAAESARAKKDMRAVRAAQAELIAFTKQSPAMANALDDIASEAARDLYLASLEHSLLQLAARKKALADARRLIVEATEQARRNTADIQLTKVHALVLETAAALRAYEQLQRDLDDADDDVLASIGAALAALKDFARIAGRHR
jgi:hypothetical protein